MIILTQNKNKIFISSIGGRYSTLKIPHFKGMDNLMIMLIPLFPYCVVKDMEVPRKQTNANLLRYIIQSQFAI